MEHGLENLFLMIQKKKPDFIFLEEIIQSGDQVTIPCFLQGEALEGSFM